MVVKIIEAVRLGVIEVEYSNINDIERLMDILNKSETRLRLEIEVGQEREDDF